MSFHSQSTGGCRPTSPKAGGRGHIRVGPPAARDQPALCEDNRPIGVLPHRESGLVI